MALRRKRDESIEDFAARLKAAGVPPAKVRSYLLKAATGLLGYEQGKEKRASAAKQKARFSTWAAKNPRQARRLARQKAKKSP